jgi:hypothetical protein
MPKAKPKPKQISRTEMAALLRERCPTMSAATVNAALSGAVLTLADGSSYQAPIVGDRKPTHHTTAKMRKVGNKWIS